MLRNYLFFFKRHFDFFKNKCLVAGLMFLAVLLLTCCFEPPKRKLLSVPHITWEYIGWCGAACIQMWAYYDNFYPMQSEIAEYIGWYGASNVYGIAEGVTYFTSRWAFASFYNNNNTQQDLAVSAQVAAVRSNVPSISIVNYGTHVIIVIGFEWTELGGGQPRADFITFNDPAQLDSVRVGAWTWKEIYFSPNPVSNKYEIVLSCPSYIYDGEDGYQEFEARDGTYYGDPGDGGEDPIQQ